eukprot:36250_1
MLLRRNLPSRNLGEILYKFKITSILRSCRQFSVSDHNDVLFSDHGTLGKLVVLDRPNALNALNLKMLEGLVEFYRQLGKLSDPKVVVVRGSGGKAFCAGGDARELYFLRRNNKYISGLAPTSDNLFRVAQLVGELPQHIQHVCLMDGVTMGGGAALSVNGRFRVCTERSLFAMPETALGWFPDAGGAYFLPRMTRNFGVFLALTGAHVKGADLLHSGIATHFVCHERIKHLQEELLHLIDVSDVPAILSKYSSETECPQYSYSEERLSQIETIFDPVQNTIEHILSNLDTKNDKWTSKQARMLRRMSPRSLKVTLEEMRRGARMSYSQCFDMERTIATECVHQPDFFEGVRAILIDKHRSPKWDPDTLKMVTENMVDAYFKTD